MFIEASTWCTRLERRRGRHAHVQMLEPVLFAEASKVILGRSLSTFQLGESGTGENLLAAARRA